MRTRGQIEKELLAREEHAAKVSKHSIFSHSENGEKEKNCLRRTYRVYDERELMVYMSMQNK